MRSEFQLQCAFFKAEQIGQYAASHDKALGAVGFGLPAQALALDARCPQVTVPMAALTAPGAAAASCEIWSGGGAAAYREFDGVSHAHQGDILFGAIQLDETRFPGSDSATPLQQAAQAAYRSIFRAIDAAGYPQVLRFWNYLADINGESHGLERYRQFNTGRQEGFLHSGRAIAGAAVPAASAVGFAQGPLTIYFLAARDVTTSVLENPRQVSAYDYPPEYGPRSPTFSRASVAHFSDHDVLFLSGTASIVGHRTLHAGDVAAQVRETVTNIRAMVAEANRASVRTRFAPGDLCYKAYVRHPSHIDAIDAELRCAFGKDIRVLYLEADLCRQDLLVEIEATAGHPLEFRFGT